jgi:hypothetical protein
MLLVSPQTRQTECTELWFVNAYRRRWRVEDATRIVNQQFSLEQFLLRSRRSICRYTMLRGIGFLLAE